MDHAEARELLEIAAVEPGGLDRLMAGDTPDSAALAGHLAGCPECAEELARIRRDATALRSVVRSLPPADLRQRTLSLVAAVGRDRGAAAPARVRDVVGSPAGAAAPGPAIVGASPSRRASPAWLAAGAAVLIAAVAATGLLVGGQREGQVAALTADLERRADAVAALERVSAASLRVASEPDSAHVALAGTGDEAARGALLFSPATKELVVIAEGLVEPGPGREFRCWVEVDGQRRSVGRMFFADDLSFWVGPVEEVAGLPDGARFGVTLVDAAGDSLDGEAVLSGAL